MTAETWKNRPYNITAMHVQRLKEGRVVEEYAIDEAPKAFLVSLCCWNDRNGCYTDEDCMLEFGHPSDVDNLRAIVRDWYKEDPSAWT